MKAAFEDWQKRKLEARNTSLHSQPIAPSLIRPLAQSGRHTLTARCAITLPAQSRTFLQPERERHIRRMNEARQLVQTTTRELLAGQTSLAAQIEASSRSKSSLGATQHRSSAERLLHASTSDRQPTANFPLAIQEVPAPGFVRTGEIPPYPARQLSAYHLAGGGRYVMSSCYFDPPLEPVRVIQSTTTFHSRKPPAYISSDSKSDSVILEEISDSEPPIYMTSDSESQSHMKEYFSSFESDIDKAKPANMSQNPSLHKDTSKNEYPFIMDEYYLDLGDHCGKHNFSNVLEAFRLHPLAQKRGCPSSEA